MPYGETLSDFLTQRKNDRYAKFMGVANFAKGIWDTLNSNQEAQKARDAEAASYGEGGWRRGYDKFQSDLDWENFQRQATLSLQNNKDWLLFQNANPGLTQEEMQAKFYATPEGQKYLGTLYDEWLKREIESSKNRIAEGAAASNDYATQPWYKDVDGRITAFKNDHPEYFVESPVLDTTGKPVVDPMTGIAKTQAIWSEDGKRAVREFINTWAKTAYPKNLGSINDYMDMLYNEQGTPSTSSTSGTTEAVKDNAYWTQKFKDYATAAKSLASKLGAMPDVQGHQLTDETSLENQLKSVIDSGLLNEEDKSVAQEAFNRSSKPGLLGKDDFNNLTKVLRYIQYIASISKPGPNPDAVKAAGNQTGLW